MCIFICMHACELHVYTFPIRTTGKFLCSGHIFNPADVVKLKEVPEVETRVPDELM